VPGPSALTQTGECEHSAQNGRRVPRGSWARLLARVFQDDVRVCPSCSGRIKVIAALTAPSAIEAFLNAVGFHPERHRSHRPTWIASSNSMRPPEPT